MEDEGDVLMMDDDGWCSSPWETICICDRASAACFRWSCGGSIWCAWTLGVRNRLLRSCLPDRTSYRILSHHLRSWTCILLLFWSISSCQGFHSTSLDALLGVHVIDQRYLEICLLWKGVDDHVALSGGQSSEIDRYMLIDVTSRGIQQQLPVDILEMWLSSLVSVFHQRWLDNVNSGLMIRSSPLLTSSLKSSMIQMCSSPEGPFPQDSSSIEERSCLFCTSSVISVDIAYLQCIPGVLYHQSCRAQLGNSHLFVVAPPFFQPIDITQDTRDWRPTRTDQRDHRWPRSGNMENHALIAESLTSHVMEVCINRYHQSLIRIDRPCRRCCSRSMTDSCADLPKMQEQRSKSTVKSFAQSLHSDRVAPSQTTTLHLPPLNVAPGGFFLFSLSLTLSPQRFSRISSVRHLIVQWWALHQTLKHIQSLRRLSPFLSTRGIIIRTTRQQWNRGRFPCSITFDCENNEKTVMTRYRGWIQSAADQEKLNVILDVNHAKREQILKFVNKEQMAQMRKDFYQQIKVSVHKIYTKSLSFNGLSSFISHDTSSFNHLHCLSSDPARHWRVCLTQWTHQVLSMIVTALYTMSIKPSEISQDILKKPPQNQPKWLCLRYADWRQVLINIRWEVHSTWHADHDRCC